MDQGQATVVAAVAAIVVAALVPLFKKGRAKVVETPQLNVDPTFPSSLLPDWERSHP
jgi:hypothetical protein